MVLVQTDYTSWRVGAVPKYVCCEKCSTEFAYTMYREAAGHGTSLYFLNEQGAADRAARRAETNLQSALAKEIDVVECPNCGSFQSDMVWEARRRYLRYLGPKFAIIALAVVVPLFFCGGIYINGTFSHLPIVPWVSIFYAAIGLAALILLMPFVRFFLSLRYDPNRDSHEQRFARGFGIGVPRADYERLIVPKTADEVPSGSSTAIQTQQDFDAAVRMREPLADVIFMGCPLRSLFDKDVNGKEMQEFRRSLDEKPAEIKFDARIAYHAWKRTGSCSNFMPANSSSFSLLPTALTSAENTAANCR